MFLHKSFSPTSFSPASWDFGDEQPVAATEARTGGKLHLRAIREGKVWAYGSTTQTRPGMLKAVGADWKPFVPSETFAGGLVGVRAKARGAVIAARGGSTAALLRGSTWNTSAAPLRASAAGEAVLLSHTTQTSGTDVNSSGGASAQLVGAIAISSSADLTAHGVRRLTKAQLAALTQV